MKKYADRIPSRRLGAFKYKRSQIPDEKKTIRKAYRTIYRT